MQVRLPRPGNVLELGSILAFGFSPLWILAAAADVTHGSRAYLDSLVGELVNEGDIALPERSSSLPDPDRVACGVRGRVGNDSTPDRHLPT